MAIKRGELPRVYSRFVYNLHQDIAASSRAPESIWTATIWMVSVSSFEVSEMGTLRIRSGSLKVDKKDLLITSQNIFKTLDGLFGFLP